MLPERLDPDLSGLGERKYVRKSSGDTGPESREDWFDESLGEFAEFAELDRLLILSWLRMLRPERFVLVVGRLAS